MSLDPMFRFIPSPRLFPPGIQHFSAMFHSDLWSAARPGEAEACRSALGHSVPRRRSEFIAGRRCAAQALGACLGRDAPDIGVVGRRQDRSPVWPDGVTGSITHTKTYTAAAVSRSVRSVGIDTEVLLRPEEIDEIASAIATEEEIRHAASTFACHRVGLTVLFSAKESLFKCLYPIVRTWFDFTHARLAAADAETGVAVVELVTGLSPEFEAGWRGAGSVRVDPPYVHTGFLLHRDAQGRLQGEPCA